MRCKITLIAIGAGLAAGIASFFLSPSSSTFNLQSMFPFNQGIQWQAPNTGTTSPFTQHQPTVCPICSGTGQQYIPNMYYDQIMGWQGGYISCSGCGGSGQIP